MDGEVAKRNLRVVKWLGTVPAVGVCTFCDGLFNVPMTALKRVADAQESLRSPDLPALQVVRVPNTKWSIKEITASTSNRWIRPPATWNTAKPPIQAISRTTNKIVQMLICLSFTLKIARHTGRLICPPGVPGLKYSLCNFPRRHGGRLVATGFARGRNVLSARPFKNVLRPLRFSGIVGVNGEQNPAVFHPAFVALGFVFRYAHTDQ